MDEELDIQGVTESKIMSFHVTSLEEELKVELFNKLFNYKILYEELYEKVKDLL